MKRLLAAALLAALLPAAHASAQKALTFDQIAAEAARIRSGLPPLPGTDWGKCGLRLRFEIDRAALSPAERERAVRLLAAPSTETSRVIGHFTFYYDTSSSSPATPALITIGAGGACQRISGSYDAFVDSAGTAFNEAWDVEIGGLGYAAPPLDPDGTYHVIITEFGGTGLYGSTSWGTTPLVPGPPPRYATTITIDNDFCDVYAPSRGIPGLRVTAAHEFHHGIQIGGYGLWNDEESYFYEITSTWMEDVVCNDVNDYYQYERDALFRPSGQFAYPGVTFTSTSGLIQYSRAIWGKFIEKRFSRAVMRRTWEEMRSMRSLPALDAALSEAGSSLAGAFLEWTYWNAHTGPGCDTVAYYPEGRQYPRIAMRAQAVYNAGIQRSIADTIEGLSSAYHPVCLLASPAAACDTSPTLVAMISNLNVGGLPAPSGTPAPSYGFRYDISPVDNGGSPPFKELPDGLFVRVAVPDPAQWASQEEIDSVRVVPVADEVVVYPNPFHPRGNRPLNFRIPAAAAGAAPAELSIFTASMDLVVQLSGVPGSPLCGNCLSWDGHDAQGRSARSGIYLYVIEAGGNRYIGKFAVIAE